jgi:uncharacterized repeat protein (TIGR03803 family)
VGSGLIDWDSTIVIDPFLKPPIARTLHLEDEEIPMPTLRDSELVSIAGRSIMATIAIAATLLLTLSAYAQTFSVIHTFSGADGAFPQAGLSIDPRGRLYGSTSSGGLNGSECFQTGCGTIFQLAPHGDGWTLSSLWKFHGPSDGADPINRPTFAPNGVLYGTTDAGGAQFCEGPGCGTAYSLRPGPTTCPSTLCLWRETIAYSFGGVAGICQGITSGMSPRRSRQPGTVELGSCPGLGDLTYDAAGNIYGTIPCCYGAVYKLTPDGTATVLYYFGGGADGDTPQAGVIFDHAGNLYGTTVGGGTNFCGTVYELSPSGSGSWTKTTLYSFQCGSDGSAPYGGVIFDSGGNLYGTTNFGGANMVGTVYELSQAGGGNWTFHLLYSLQYGGTFDFLLYGPTGSLAMDSSGSLYGAAVLDGAFGGGSVFKLTPSNGGWTYTSLHDFRGGTDGEQPFGSVLVDADGTVYGTASQGGLDDGCGSPGCGTVWKITQ